MEHYGFTKIGQYKNVIKDVLYESNRDGVVPPTLKFTGTVKMHGSNAGISYIPGEHLSVQSRTRIVTPTDDNAGWANFVEERKEAFETLMEALLVENSSKEAVHNYTPILFGEWCGGNIQKGIALNELPKMFVVFAVKYVNVNDPEDSYYAQTRVKDEEQLIFNILDFPMFEIEIDFNKPQIAQNQIVQWVEQVEALCPVGKHFGVEGIGEGIVFSNYDENGHRKHIFKAKGKKHSTCNVKTIAPVDLEKMKSIEEFTDYAFTENRCNQAIEQVFIGTNTEVDQKGTGNFIKWVVSDIIAEETDTMTASNLTSKDIGKYVSKLAKNWFFTYIDQM